jgi:hypothetical protein
VAGKAAPVSDDRLGEARIAHALMAIMSRLNVHPGGPEQLVGRHAWREAIAALDAFNPDWWTHRKVALIREGIDGARGTQPRMLQLLPPVEV